MPHPSMVAEKPRRPAVSTEQAPLGRRDLACSGCGYGIVVARRPDRCPMCGDDQWEFAPWRPFARDGWPDTG